MERFWRPVPQYMRMVDIYENCKTVILVMMEKSKSLKMQLKMISGEK